MIAKFDSGYMFVSRPMMKMCRDDLSVVKDVKRAMTCFKNCDWGETYPPYANKNNLAVVSDGEIMAMYALHKDKHIGEYIYIIQENRGDNTYLFYSEELK